jgi:hypothetical protein
MRMRSALLATALAAGCATPQRADEPVIGMWGGPRVGLELTPAGGSVAYDCAAGTIDEPIRPDAAGRFAAVGSHVPGHGGPDRVDEVSSRFPARYAGRIEGATMTLRVTVPARALELGPFQLRRDAPPDLLRCL